MDFWFVQIEERRKKRCGKTFFFRLTGYGATFLLSNSSKSSLINICISFYTYFSHLTSYSSLSQCVDDEEVEKSFFFIDSFQSKLIKYFNVGRLAFFSYASRKKERKNKRERNVNITPVLDTSTMIVINDFHKLPGQSNLSLIFGC